MSFLDVICCGFGAMVLLVLLSKTDVAGGTLNIDAVKNLLGNIIAEKKKKTANEQARDRLLEETQTLEAGIEKASAPGPNLSGAQKRLAEKQAQAEALQFEINALAQQSSRTDKVVKVGGIPVDSDYIIFIVDTSGSMQSIWSRVIRELENVLDIHPKVKGFQIMNDNGIYLIKAYARKWIPDTPKRRKSVLSAMKTWRSFSNSSPVEGLEKALRTYSRTGNLSIYVFGDEYTGGSYDPVLNTLEKLNRDSTGTPIARINGIGFRFTENYLTTDYFATLMREVARLNRGAFVALKQ